MNTRDIASEYRLSHWAQVVQERLASGKSIKEYCESMVIKENVYYYWQRKLREAACVDLVSNTKAIPDKSRTPNGWSLCKQGITESVAPLTVEIGKFRINVNTGVDTTLLARICQVLRTLC
jgi:putative transposase